MICSKIAQSKVKKIGIKFLTNLALPGLSIFVGPVHSGVDF